jgi:opacity protein-like surface antigen
MQKTTLIQRTLLLIVVVLTTACAGNKGPHKVTLNYIEYNRGKSFPTHSDVQMDWNGNSVLLKDVRFEDDSFFPDNSIIPNAFFKPLFQLKFNDALKAFTEPYYGYRFIHFFKSNPRLGIGIEFTHHKIFLNQPEQIVNISGTYNGEPLAGTAAVGEYVDYLSVSHGVNHLSLLFTYRWLLNPTPSIPEGRLQPYVAAGLGPSIPHLELKLRETAPAWNDYSYQSGLNNFNFGVGMGMRYKFSPHFGCYLEYKIAYSHLHDLTFNDGAGTLKMSFTTHHLMWGLSYIF